MILRQDNTYRAGWPVHQEWHILNCATARRMHGCPCLSNTEHNGQRSVDASGCQEKAAPSEPGAASNETSADIAPAAGR